MNTMKYCTKENLLAERFQSIWIIFTSFVDYLPGWAYGRNGSIFQTTSVECPEGEEKEQVDPSDNSFYGWSRHIGRYDYTAILCTQVWCSSFQNKNCFMENQCYFHVYVSRIFFGGRGIILFAREVWGIFLLFLKQDFHRGSGDSDSLDLHIMLIIEVFNDMFLFIASQWLLLYTCMFFY